VTKNNVQNIHRQTSLQTMTPLTNRCCDDCVIQVGPHHCQVSKKNI